MTDFIVKAVHLDGFSWPVMAMLQSLDRKELGDAEWWRRMAVLQNAAARTGDGNLLAVLDNAKKNRFNEGFEAPEVVSTNNLPPLSVEECVKRWFQELDEDNKLNILKVAMTKMLEATDNEGKKLFAQKQHWMAVYMVIRDRLGMNIPLNKFYTYAEKDYSGQVPCQTSNKFNDDDKLFEDCTRWYVLQIKNESESFLSPMQFPLDMHQGIVLFEDFY